LKGVDEPWRHDGNVFRTGPHDFHEDSRERNWNIYNMRVIEKRTLEHIAKVHGLSRERIRQIVFKGERLMALRKWVRGENKKQAEMAIGALPLSTRMRNAMMNELGPDWWKVNILLFCAATSKEEMRRWPNVGNKTLNDLHEMLQKVDRDAANLWASRNRENNNPSEHG